MTEETKPPEDAAKKKKVHPAAIIGPMVAIGAALIVIFVSGNKEKEGPPPEMGPDTGQLAPGADQTQLAQVQQAPLGPVVKAQINSQDQALTFSAVFPDAPANDPVITALRKDAESYLTRKKQPRGPKLTG
jgi:hypothetical protein